MTNTAAPATDDRKRWYFLQHRRNTAHMQIDTVLRPSFKWVAIITCETFDEAVAHLKRQGWPQHCIDAAIANSRSGKPALNPTKKARPKWGSSP